MLTTPPVASQGLQQVGRRLYTDLAQCLGSHVDWFGEGLPGEWLTALDRLQAVVSDAKKRAQAAQQACEAAEADRQGRLW